MGMAHRGRLNTLTNIFEKPAHDILAEFEGKEFDEDGFDGDVKYHQGFTSRITTTGGHESWIDLISKPFSLGSC